MYGPFGSDPILIDGLQLLSQWEEAFNHPTGSKLGLLGAIQNIGSLACLPFSPYACDLMGRKKTIFMGALIIVAGAIIQTASQSVNMFIGARFMSTIPLIVSNTSRNSNEWLM